MQRRKLLVGIGALATGGTAAFGTEAFTSLEAERNVDVSIVGDASAFLAITPTAGSDNANKYVSKEDDKTVTIDLDGEASGNGSGLNNDALVDLDNLITVLNQGSQPVSIYVEDDSDAVTFRSSGASIEGSSNSVDINVGGEVDIGLTVDTLNNNISSGGTLIDSASIYATADGSTPGGV